MKTNLIAKAAALCLALTTLAALSIPALAQQGRMAEAAQIGADGFVDVGAGPGSGEGEYIDWLIISDQTASVVADVQRVRPHPLVPSSIPICGCVYDVKTGKLGEVPEAAQAGKAA